jgi:hypothetical protein
MTMRRKGFAAAVILDRGATLAAMAGGFDVSRAVGAGLGGRLRAREFIAGFAAAWMRPLAPGDGYSDDVLWAAGERLGVRLPEALRDAYLLFGRRADLTAGQDPLLPPDRLRMDHAAPVIVFREENQDCAEWGGGRDGSLEPRGSPGVHAPATW